MWCVARTRTFAMRTTTYTRSCSTTESRVVQTLPPQCTRSHRFMLHHQRPQWLIRLAHCRRSPMESPLPIACKASNTRMSVAEHNLLLVSASKSFGSTTLGAFYGLDPLITIHLYEKIRFMSAGSHQSLHRPFFYSRLYGLYQKVLLPVLVLDTLVISGSYDETSCLE